MPARVKFTIGKSLCSIHISPFYHFILPNFLTVSLVHSLHPTPSSVSPPIVYQCIVPVWNSMHNPGCQTVTLLPEPPRFWDSSYMSPSSNPPWFSLNSLKAAPHCHSAQNVNTNSCSPLKSPPGWGSETALGSPTTPGAPLCGPRKERDGTDVEEMGPRVEVTTDKEPCIQCLRHQRWKIPPAPWETLKPPGKSRLKSVQVWGSGLRLLKLSPVSPWPDRHLNRSQAKFQGSEVSRHE